MLTRWITNTQVQGSLLRSWLNSRKYMLQGSYASVINVQEEFSCQIYIFLILINAAA